jgi:hypothetical protein
MDYAIGIGGLIGLYMLGFALFAGKRFSHDWKRWAVGLIGTALAAILFIAHPVLWKAVSGVDTEHCGSGPTSYEC